MRSWESARPLEKVGLGSEAEDHMDLEATRILRIVVQIKNQRMEPSF